LLLDRLAGACAVFDVDWLIDPLRRATPDGRVDWPSFRDCWPLSAPTALGPSEAWTVGG
jgi:hypothetical protein